MVCVRGPAQLFLVDMYIVIGLGSCGDGRVSKGLVELSAECEDGVVEYF